MASSWLDYFSAGVPTLGYTQMHFDDLLELAEKSPQDIPVDFIAELCVIGLAAYVEAFCKDHFAAMINICLRRLHGHSDLYAIRTS